MNDLGGRSVTLADQVRDFISRHYLDHGPRAHNWHRLADEIDRLEGTKPSGLDIDAVHAHPDPEQGEA
jgi:hypothetical protein